MNKKLFGFIFIFVLIFTGLFANNFTNVANAAVATITGFTPISEKAGDTIIINGTNLDSFSSVDFGPVSSMNSSLVNSTQITAEVPADLTPGNVKITVKTTDAGDPISTDNFNVLASNTGTNTATISTFYPLAGKVGDLITVNGTNLNDITSILVGDNDTNVIAKTSNSGEVTFNVPAGATSGAIKIVTSANGTAESSIGFDVLAADGTVIGKSAVTPPPAGTTTPGSTSINDGRVVPKCNTGPINTTTGQYVTPCDFSYFMLLINNVIKFLLFVIATPLMALIIIYMGWLMISAGGSSEKVTKVKHILFNAVIGYVIALAAWLIVNTIITTLKVDPGINTFMSKIDKNY